MQLLKRRLVASAATQEELVRQACSCVVVILFMFQDGDGCMHHLKNCHFCSWYLMVVCTIGKFVIFFSWSKMLMEPFSRTSTTACHTGSLSWNGDVLCSGSRDHTIQQWDPRMPPVPTRKLHGHTHEVCGLKWSPDHQLLASGGNDNKVCVGKSSSGMPRLLSAPM